MRPTDSLHPIIPDNAHPLRITAAAGTKLAGASSLATVIILTNERTLQLVFSINRKNLFCLPHSRSITGSGFRPLSKIPHCWLCSLILVSVPMWLLIFSDQLKIVDFVSFFPTNYLILYKLIFTKGRFLYFTHPYAHIIKKIFN